MCPLLVWQPQYYIVVCSCKEQISEMCVFTPYIAVLISIPFTWIHSFVCMRCISVIFHFCKSFTCLASKVFLLECIQFWCTFFIMPVYGLWWETDRKVARIDVDVAYNLGILSEKFDIEEAFCRRKTVFLSAVWKVWWFPYSLGDTFILQLWCGLADNPWKSHTVLW